MTSRKWVRIGFGAALLGGVLSAAAAGDALYDHKTRFIFTRAIELPGGITLQPGTYTFRLAESVGRRHIVEVLNANETSTFATMLAVEPLEEAVVMFGETPPDRARPMRFWYHAGRGVGPVGYEFVYPKDQATRIARTTRQSVLMTEASVDDVDAMKKAQVAQMSPTHPPRTWSSAADRERGGDARQQSHVAQRERSEATGMELSPGVRGVVILLGVLLGIAVNVHRHHSSRSPARPSRLLARERWPEKEVPHGKHG